VINIISWISLAGITIGTMALIVVLSVFNGFEHLVIGLMNTFDADLEITAVKGKTFDPAILPGEEIRTQPGVLSYAGVLEENALMRYRGHQHIVTLKGVDEEYVRSSPLDSLLLDGEFVLNDGQVDRIVVGAGVAWFLEMNIHDRMSPAEIFLPRRGAVSTLNPLDAFNRELVFPSGVFSVQQEFDTRYAIVPLGMMRRLLEYHNEVSCIEIRLSPEADPPRVKERVEALAGPAFRVKDRMEQQETLYRIMQTERWAIFFILSFIIIIAAFNMVGSVSMLVIDKRKDMAVLWSMGAGRKVVRGIFFNQGLLLTAAGAAGGLILGALLCWAQQQFGLIRLGASEGSFVVDAYPVRMVFSDFILVLFTVMAIGSVASWLPTLRLKEDENRRFYLSR
jgi:ABC-type lipoprotein release transport system permease subunit